MTRAGEAQSSSLKRFLAYARPYRWWLGGAIVCGIIRYAIPLALPWSIKILVDEFLPPQSRHPHAQLHLLMLSLCGLYGVYAISSYWRFYLAGFAGHRLIHDLRQALYLHVQRMSLGFFERQKVGAVVSRMTTDIAAAQNFVGAAFVNTSMDLSCIALIIVVLFSAHAKLALVSLTVLPCYALVSGRLQRRIRENSRLMHRQLQDISGTLHEQLAGISTVQAFTREDTEAREFEAQNEAFFDTVIGNVKLQAIALGATGFLTAIGPILVLWVGAAEVWAGRLSVGMLMAFYGYLGMLYQPIQRLTELNLILANSLAAMDRIFEVFDTFPDVQERAGAVSLPRAKGELAFEDVSFRYDAVPFAPKTAADPRADAGPTPAPVPLGRLVLDHLTLHIPAGTTAALIGPSGAGKTTLVKLLPRFYDVASGRIMIDGADIRSVTLKSLREQIAIVPQEPILFSGTIAENLRYGRPDAGEDAVRAAARAAFAEVFIEQWPDGYETQIGERGVRLSGGQKQRLAIARAFVKDAPIVILDEPTSALDAESEDLIKQALARLLDGRTALIIAHRLSTIEHADVVIVLDHGRIIEQGRHAALLRSGGLYRRYAQRQLGAHLNAPTIES